jgi:hypothetical protein
VPRELLVRLVLEKPEPLEPPDKQQTLAPREILDQLGLPEKQMALLALLALLVALETRETLESALLVQPET